MARRITAVLVGLLFLGGLAVAPAIAQTDEDSPATTEPIETTTTQVAGNSTTTEAPTTTTEAPTTTTQVAGVSTTAATAQPATEVKGDVVTRPLPRTGNDISGTAIFGGALTLLGIALALGARKRRNGFDGA